MSVNGKDPYSVLGVDRNATDEEIKKVYHDLVKKYHPDRYKDEKLAQIANEKMTEINAAYDEIEKMRAQGQTSGTSGSYYGSTGSYTSYGGRSSSYSGDHSEMYSSARRFINEGEVLKAEAILMSVPEADRNAEWYFLRGCVLVRRGNYMDAGRCFDAACSMDPYNQEYANARAELRRHTYGGERNSTYETHDCNTGCGGDCCTDLCKLCCFLRLCPCFCSI